ncbi:hypothetical protein TWF718_007894 [Orbilia javanica]|uniref:Apple domain-containing protein n=1 Tax=Orbilia javanica TaxID=47235 RepID=A0AAN8RGU7_9PEZI
MLFSTIYAFALLALSTLVLGGKEHCVVPPLSCQILPLQSSTSCISVISQLKIPRSTCTTCTKTTVVPTPFTPTNTVYTTINTIATIWVTKPTVAVITKSSVVTKFSTVVVSSTRWSTSTKRTTISYTPLPSQTCLQKRDLDIRQAITSLPEICSCYIPVPRETGIYTMQLTVFAPNITTTIKSTSTKTTTLTRFTTQTSQTLLLKTTIKTTISTTWKTSTTTRTIATTVSNPSASACISPSTYTRRLSSSTSSSNPDPNLSTVSKTNIQDFKACCNLCFKETGCNSYEYNKPAKTCILRKSKKSVGCKTGFCPLGLQKLFLTSGTAANVSWGTGPCSSSSKVT